MTGVRIVHREAFRACGKKVWISGQDSSQFADFWQKADEDGLTDLLRRTGGSVFGVSRVELDPSDRAFRFYIAAETDEVPECGWAIFRNTGRLPDALVEAEMYEAYPETGIVEYHLPIEKPV